MVWKFKLENFGADGQRYFREENFTADYPKFYRGLHGLMGSQSGATQTRPRQPVENGPPANATPITQLKLGVDGTQYMDA
jgi:hypothetical protein